MNLFRFWNRARNRRTPGGSSPRLACVRLEDRTTPATFNVTNTNDAGAGSLRQAITSANADAVADTVLFSSLFNAPQTIILASSLPAITQPVTIDGPSVRVTVSGNDAVRILAINTSGAVTLRDLTLTKGKVSNLNNGGAVLLQSGTLTVDRCVISNNQADFGSGGVHVQGASTVTVKESTFSGNSTNTEGAALVFAGGGKPTILSSTFAANAAGADGGAVIFAGTFTGGTVLIQNSTFSGNTSGSDGGAISFFNFNDTLLVQNSTIAGNSAKSTGGGIGLTSGTGSITNESTVFTLNSAPTGKDIKSANTVTSTNSAYDTTAGITTFKSNGGNFIGDPFYNLGPLTNNGGPTQSRRLLPFSSLLNKGANPAALTDDQRGQPRVFGAAADIGAVEIGSETITVDSAADENDGDFGPGDLTLREAVGLSNGYTNTVEIIEPDLSVFAAPTTITLTLGEITITDSLLILGEGVWKLSGNNASRIFNVNGAASLDVTFDQITFTNGKANGGGAVLAIEELVTFSSCSFTNNTSTSTGGAVSVLNTVNFTAGFGSFYTCTFTNNTATNNGGAVHIGIGVGAFLTECILDGNTSTNGDGGAAYLRGGPVTFSDCTISDNDAFGAGGDGGGIRSVGDDTDLLIERCTFFENNAGRFGGGLAVGENLAGNGGKFVITDSTFSDNRADHGGGFYFGGTLKAGSAIRNSTISGNRASLIGGSGGGIKVTSPSTAFLIQNSTITKNTADQGGGIRSSHVSGAMTIESSVVSDNTLYTGGAEPNISTPGTVTVSASAVTDTAGIATLVKVGFNILTATDLKLGTLAVNGGPTTTHAVLDGSPLRNKGSNPAALTTDQRGAGYRRAGNGTADIGAYESPTDIVVTLPFDESDGNLAPFDLSYREAVSLANAGGNFQDRILFAVTGSVTLTLGEVTVTDSLILQGPGSDKLSMFGNNAFRPLNINATGALQDIFVDGLTFVLCAAPAAGADGGAIQVADEKLTVTNCLFVQNFAADRGGAVHIAGGSESATFTDCDFVSNSAFGTDGGAIAHIGKGALTLTRCLFGNNSAADDGGGVYVAAAKTDVTAVDCTFTGNSADSGGGFAWDALNLGGLDATPTFLFQGCTFSNNKATAGDGGALFLVDAAGQTTRIRNCTLSGNTASSDGGAIAVSNPQSALTVQSSTLTLNSATGNGGGIFTGGAGGSVVLESAIVFGNTSGGSGPDVSAPNPVSASSSALGSLSGITTFSDLGKNLAVGTDPLLGPLADNGGLTLTHLPASDSPVIDKGSNPAPLLTDQRGQPRLLGLGAEIGAVERLRVVVTNTNDSGPGSLRQAILAANLNADPVPDAVTFDAVVFATPQTITLTTGEIKITDAVTVVGPTAGVSVSGGNVSRVFTTEGAPTGAQIELSDMTFTGGNATNGGALSIGDEAVTLANCTFTANKATDGGAIFVSGAATLTVLDGTISQNTASSEGGGINVDGVAAVVIQNSNLTGNSATVVGGGIHVKFGGSLLLEGSTLSGNTAGSFGGGIDMTADTGKGGATVRNSTLSGNVAGGSGGGISFGGFTENLLIQNSTITGNKASSGSGGGIHQFPSGTPTSIAVESSIIAGNSGKASGPDISAVKTLTVNFSAVGDAGGFTLTGSNNLPFGVNLKLGPLGDNGGPTQTHALLAGSPAIDAGSNPAGLADDQRGPGFPRLSGAAADIGAFEQPSTTVFNASNSGVGSLRQAILNANSLPGADIVNFDPVFFATPRTITVTSQLSITDAVSILGPGANLATISGGNFTRVFSISTPGTKAAVLISDVTITKGKTTFTGAGIFNDDEALTLDGCVITANTVDNVLANSGGGIHLQTATASLVVNNCTISGNTADLDGGGINVAAASSVTITNSTVSGNSAATDGGGIAFANGGSLFFEDSTLSGNKATAGDGGGLLFSGTVGSAGVTIRNSTVSGNTAGSDGGGIALANLTGAIRVQNSTVTLNTATAGSGGGIARPSGTGSIVVTSSIISGNTNTAAADVSSAGTVSVGFCAIGSSKGFTLTGSNNLPFGSNLKLGALSNNGGPTFTHALLVGSAAIDTGDNPVGLTADQRGPVFDRVSGKAADIGAFEVQQPAHVSAVVISDSASQRSRVTQVRVDFDQLVTLPANAADAFQLKRQSDSAAVSLAAVVTNTSVTSVTLTFSGAPTEFGSLADGRYTLTVVASKVSSPNGLLDGDGNGFGGDNFVLVGDPATNRLHRLFGDNDGDGDTDSLDFLQFRNTNGLVSGDPGFNSAFDFDGDGDVDAQDFLQCRLRIGTAV